MPRSVKILNETGFSGGLRLDVDAFQLPAGASPDLMNVDCDPRGGFALRKAFTPINTSAAPFTSPIHSMFAYGTTGGTEQVLVGSGNYTYSSTGGNFASTGIGWTVSSPQVAATLRDLLYIQNGTDAPRRWSGTSAVTLTDPAAGPTWSENFASPSDGDMPIAKAICQWQNYLWVANTYENGTRFGSRVRFSHPNRGEDWRELDYIDIDVGHDGDQITALIPLSDRLLVFKNRSVHMISGYDADTFSVNFVANVGAPSQRAVVATEYGVYFFSWPRGVFVYTDRGISYEFQALEPAILNGDIPDAYHAEIAGGYIDRRVWFSVPYGSSTENARTYVLTPGNGAGWVQYDEGFSALLEWPRLSSERFPLGATSGNTDSVRVMKLNVDRDDDEWYSDYLTLSAESGSYASAPDSAGTSVSGDLDIRALVELASWAPGSGGNRVFLSKYSSSTNKGYEFGITQAGNLYFTYGTGSASATRTATAITSLSANTKAWVRVTVDVNDGGGNHVVKFYVGYDKAAVGSANWTQVGSTVTTAGTITIGDGVDSLFVGARPNDSLWLDGKFFAAEVHNSITAASLVAAPDFTTLVAGSTSMTDSQANVWTIGAAATLSSRDTSISSYYQTRWFDAGSAAVMKRWKRPVFVMDADQDAVLRVGVYKDYNPNDETKWFSATVDGLSDGTEWGDGLWGEGLWGSGNTGTQSIKNGGILGRGRSVALKFTGPEPSARWSINSIDFKFIPRRVR